MINFIVKRIKGFKYAAKGAYLLLKNEASIKVQFSIAVIMTVLGFYVQLSVTEWCLQLLAIGLVMSIEGVNSAIEEIADFIHPEYHEKIGRIKDISAGAVFIAATIACILGLVIYLPKILEVVNS